jgi:SAM-dependent methyltransferase
VIVHADPSNAEQLRAWDGDQGRYWAEKAAHFDRAVAGYHRRFMDAAGIQTGDTVLDIGCGTGETTRDAATRSGSGSALGVDLSSRMIELARRLAAAAGISNAHFAQGDAQVHPFDAAGHDVVISRTGTMFFGDPVGAFTNIARALRPHGTLALLTWRDPAHNEWMRELGGALAAGRDLPAPSADAPGPFSLADPGRVRHILGAAGFVDVTLEEVRAPMWWGADPGDAQRFVLGLMGWMLDGLDDRGRALALEGLRRTLENHRGSGGVELDSAAWIIRARRP